MNSKIRGDERRVRGLIWGLILISAGVVFLLQMYEQLPWDVVENWWPLFPIAVGLGKLFTARDPRELGSAVTTLGIGGWLLVANNGWYGLTWSRSWPLALVAVGLGTVVQSLAAWVWRRNPSEEEGHVG